jgi:hypothetical protein
MNTSKLHITREGNVWKGQQLLGRVQRDRDLIPGTETFSGSYWAADRNTGSSAQSAYVRVPGKYQSRHDAVGALIRDIAAHTYPIVDAILAGKQVMPGARTGEQILRDGQTRGYQNVLAGLDAEGREKTHGMHGDHSRARCPELRCATVPAIPAGPKPAYAQRERCANCGNTETGDNPVRTTVIDWRTDKLCDKCVASFEWSEDDWYSAPNRTYIHN